MTCIAWDGKVLAGDRMRIDGSGNAPTISRKVYRVKTPDGRRLLIGLAGDAYDCTAFLRWVQNPTKHPKPAPTGLSAMVIDERKRIWFVNDKLVYIHMRAKRAALGCGYQFALAAMACGRDAAGAVRIAAKLDRAVGMGCDTVRF